MYDNETKNQFIELRANGLSLDAISAQLSVPKTTLGRWHHESLEQIQRLRALQWHLLEDQIGERLEDILGRIAQRIRKWDNKLDGQLSVYQKPGDSIRVIRESRREYLQLRALLLAPLQPARRNAPCLTSADPEKRDKTGQNSYAPETTPLPLNDLQRPETSMSHSDEAAHPLVTPDVRRGLTSPESLESPSAHNHNLNLNLNPSSPDPVRDPATHQSEIDSPSSASPRLCGEFPGTPPINTPLQRGEPAQPPAAPTASAVYPGCHGEPIPPASGGANSVKPATPVAESSDTIITSTGSPALPVQNSAPPNRKSTLPLRLSGETATENPKSKIQSSPPSLLPSLEILAGDS